ncbi:hypothetical protein [Enterocloster lavalensis]|uniref:hypothetical protein n=1 Tax=Enterocloster lavalensis TaxID=460384 RepID=UPI0023F3110C|nr:hypothetical protein [Enterocloster lavalensis]
MGEENRLLEELALYEEQCGCLEEQVAELSGRIKNAEFLDENAARSFAEKLLGLVEQQIRCEERFCREIPGEWPTSPAQVREMLNEALRMKMVQQVNRFYALCGDERVGGKLKAEQEKLRGLLSPDSPAGELENALEPYVQYVRTFDIINRRAEGSTRIGFLMRFFDEELVDALAEHRIQEREDTAVEPQAGEMAAGTGSAVKAMSAGLVKPAEMDGSCEAETAATDVDAGDLEAVDETEVDAVVWAETVGVPEEETLELDEPGEGTLELGEPGEDVLELDEPDGGTLELGEPGEDVLELVGPDEEALEPGELGEEDLELGEPDEEDLELGEPDEEDLELGEPDEGDLELGEPDEEVLELSEPDKEVLELYEPGEETLELDKALEEILKLEEPDEIVFEQEEAGENVLELDEPDEETLELEVLDEETLELDEPDEETPHLEVPDEETLYLEVPDEESLEQPAPEPASESEESALPADDAAAAELTPLPQDLLQKMKEAGVSFAAGSQPSSWKYEEPKNRKNSKQRLILEKMFRLAKMLRDYGYLDQELIGMIASDIPKSELKYAIVETLNRGWIAKCVHEGYPVIYLESALAPRIALDMQSGDVQVKVETYGEAAKDECGAWNHYLYAVLLKYFMKMPGIQSIQVQIGPYYTVIQGEYDGKTIAAEIAAFPESVEQSELEQYTRSVDACAAAEGAAVIHAAATRETALGLGRWWKQRFGSNQPEHYLFDAETGKFVELQGENANGAPLTEALRSLGAEVELMAPEADQETLQSEENQPKASGPEEIHPEPPKCEVTQLAAQNSQPQQSVSPVPQDPHPGETPQAYACPADQASAMPQPSPADDKNPDKKTAVIDWESTYRNIQEMLAQDKYYCAFPYLTAKGLSDRRFYQALAYAFNEPVSRCEYTSTGIFDIFQSEDMSGDELMRYLYLAAALRNFFYNHVEHDYMMEPLHGSLQGFMIENMPLNELIYEFKSFKREFSKGIDYYADYRCRERLEVESQIERVTKQAESFYELILAPLKESVPQKRFLITQDLIFKRGSMIAGWLESVKNDERELRDYLLEEVQAKFIKDGCTVCEQNLDPEKINRYLDECWDESVKSILAGKKTSDLMGNLRTKLYNRIYKNLVPVCCWLELVDRSDIAENDPVLAEYRRKKDTWLGLIEAALERNRELEKTAVLSQVAGLHCLNQALCEFKRKLNGEYQEAEQKYFYVNLLRNDQVLLTGGYTPDLRDRCEELGGFSLEERLILHSKQPEREWEERLYEIFEGENEQLYDYGSGEMILAYLNDLGLSDGLKTDYDVSTYVKRERVDFRYNNFVEELELAQSYGKIYDTKRNQKQHILSVSEAWYHATLESNNYGFYFKVLARYREKIDEDAREQGIVHRRQFEKLLAEHKEYAGCPVAGRIEEMLKVQNYTVAEDLIRRLRVGETELAENEFAASEDYLTHFCDTFDENHRLAGTSGRTLKNEIASGKFKKDMKGGQLLIDNWLVSGQEMGTEKMKRLMGRLGFNVEKVQKISDDKLEKYTILMKRPQNGRRNNFKHPIAVFGSLAAQQPIQACCLYGYFDTDRLIETCKSIGTSKNTIVFLDYKLSMAERRRLARKMKNELPEKVFAIVDRVVLVYLAANYNETAVNKMLMAVTMPYTFYQPYVWKSSNDMPAELFMGRKRELDEIESPNGANIVYGGRQLGKSALLKMAAKEIDRNENGDRAVFIEIKKMNVEQTAAHVSRELIDCGVLEDGQETGDWDELARSLKRRLNVEGEKRIPYLLLLLDEADVFIERCAAVNYAPLDALKSVQQMGVGRFKFVIAGLRNIVRFNREAALGNNSVIPHFSAITVRPFNVEDAKELLEVPLSYLGLRFPDASMETLILATTNYFPGLIQLYCARLLESLKEKAYGGYDESNTPPYLVKDKHIEKVLADQEFSDQIREKFFITLKEGEDNYYYIICILIAYLYHTEGAGEGYTAKQVQDLGRAFEIDKISQLPEERLYAFMMELCELNVLCEQEEGGFGFSRYNFFQMLGNTLADVENEIIGCMDGAGGV